MLDGNRDKQQVTVSYFRPTALYRGNNRRCTSFCNRARFRHWPRL